MVIWATPLYKFLKYCNDSPLDKTVLDCGAGGDDPPLQLFYECGYETFGVEVAENPFRQAKKFCREHCTELNIMKGDMRHLSFKNASFSFVYSLNAIFFMTKKDIKLSIKEIERILKVAANMDLVCLINRSKPPALPGRLSEFDIFGNIRKPLIREPLLAHRTRGFQCKIFKL